jgi:hypothetical protein
MPTRTLAAAACLAVGAALTLPATAAASPLPTPSTTLIKPGVSIGGVKLGASFAQARSAWGTVKCKQEFEFLNCSYGAKGTGVAVYSLTGAAVSTISISVGVTKAGKPKYTGSLLGLKTAKGIGLGSTRKAVKGAYPKIKDGGASGILRLEGKGPRFTTLTVTKGRVTTIAVESGLLG